MGREGGREGGQKSGVGREECINWVDREAVGLELPGEWNEYDKLYWVTFLKIK